MSLQEIVRSIENEVEQRDAMAEGEPGTQWVTDGQLSKATQRAAIDLCNERGVRSMEWGGGFRIGIWSDLDGPDLRAALAVLGLDSRPLVYLESADIPLRYKLCPLPEQQRAKSWAAWQAEQLNRIFEGRTGQLGRITETTVRHDERRRKRAEIS